MTYETILLAAGCAALVAALVAFAWWLGLREGYTRGTTNADPQGAYDRGWHGGLDVGRKTGERDAWRDAHRVALEALKLYPTSRGGRKVVKALAAVVPRNADGAA